MMGIYEDLAFCKEENVRCVIVPLTMECRIMADSENGYKYPIELNNNLSFNRRARVLVHEILHLSSMYKKLLGKFKPSYMD